ncbi:lysosomal alpha-glucosidase-like protein [Dinothrombium tinctorium]|uniref:Lysosomal alpha-glucosidase-like protein n=1 Tax=Dinothrombium tinctorium TaxID=1965070 RepID=A0A3S3NI71_9ACAR|nr:lysosomal alpha-glucosidase-like protein [Dinothrombium tinctorium]
MKFIFCLFLQLTLAKCIICLSDECSVERESRLDCHPENDASEEACTNRGCCWRQTNDETKVQINEPACFYPKSFKGYKVEEIRSNLTDTTIILKRAIPSGLPKDVKAVKLQIITINGRILRLRFTDAQHKRFIPQLPKLNFPKDEIPKLYSFEVYENGTLRVIRNSTERVVFETQLNKLVFSNQFHQLSSKLPSKYVYGLGEHKDTFRKTADWQRYTFFNRDQYPIPHSALYGSHPFYLTVEDSVGHSSGVFLLNTNPMDIILTPEPAIIFRPIGGILDFFIFIGDNPSVVARDYVNLIGLPPMPPLWGLGFHLCRLGYKTLNDLAEVWKRTRDALIPFDVQWNDMDYMNRRNDFTVDLRTYKYLPIFVDYLHRIGMRYVMIIEPGISGGEKPGTYMPYDEGLCLSAKHYIGLQYDIHNIHSTYEVLTTYKSLQKIKHNKRPFIISRSTFSGTGRYGYHWDGDVYSDWFDMKWTIASILNFNIFGIPLIGADMCGFNGNTTVELCARWMALGAFYPFARNHNSDDTIEQDPVALGETVVAASRNALSIRYILLPYLYTLFYKAHKFGETVARPLFFVYPNDKISYEIETQFFWGSGLMIVPVLEPNVLSIKAYLPPDRWYKHITFEPIDSNGLYIEVSAPIDQINLFIRGGEIIPFSESVLLTKQLLTSDFRLLVALNKNNEAFGELFWDDGESFNSIIKKRFNLVKFEAKNNTLLTIVQHYGLKREKFISSIIVTGVYFTPKQVSVNGRSVRFQYYEKNKYFLVRLSNQSLYYDFKMEWS